MESHYRYFPSSTYYFKKIKYRYEAEQLTDEAYAHRRRKDFNEGKQSVMDNMYDKPLTIQDGGGHRRLEHVYFAEMNRFNAFVLLAGRNSTTSSPSTTARQRTQSGSQTICGEEFPKFLSVKRTCNNCQEEESNK